MTKLILFLMIFMVSNTAWPYDSHRELQVGVTRKGGLYTLIASFDTSLTQCAAYHYLTDYGGAKDLPEEELSEAERKSLRWE